MYAIVCPSDGLFCLLFKCTFQLVTRTERSASIWERVCKYYNHRIDNIVIFHIDHSHLSYAHYESTLRQFLLRCCTIALCTVDNESPLCSSLCKVNIIKDFFIRNESFFSNISMIWHIWF